MPDVTTTVVEEGVQFTLVELCRACGAETGQLVALVYEGVLEPTGSEPDDWGFDGGMLRRARVALRLVRDLHVNPPGVALALNLLDEIEALSARLRVAGIVVR